MSTTVAIICGALVGAWLGTAAGYFVGAAARNSSYRQDLELTRAALETVRRDPGRNVLSQVARDGVDWALSETSGRW